MDVNKKGNITELQVMLAAIKKGYIVSIPYGDCDKYDQLWDDKTHIYRVQVKTARWKDERHTAIIFNCYSVSNGKKHKYTDKEIDFFATFWDDKCYLIPVSECSSEKTLWFELSPYNHSKCCMAKDYELSEVKQDI